MRRILVVGSTGAGKSALARGLSARLGLPCHEMDALYFTGAARSPAAPATRASRPSAPFGSAAPATPRPG
ncbi:hypothetical protein [Streptomyces sp. NPDC097610]|uniref:hypothetical protein n=1 Tax=Streptomyces sp. NPDC097610 TaxID=3157227 RepID=UPI00331A0992